jgi:sugar/nucleoside kinase (ribokinase family)
MSSADRSLLVVGSVAVDDIDGPFGWQRDLLGGSASFISVAASYFTRNVSLVAVVGDDFDEEHLAYFRSRGIDTRGVERRSGKTFRWVGRYADDLASRETLDTQLGVFGEFRPRLPEEHGRAELVFLGNIDPVLQLEVVEQVQRPRLIAADTMNFWINGHRASLVATLGRVHTLVINDEEARQLAGEHNLVRAAAGIRKMGPRSSSSAATPARSSSTTRGRSPPRPCRSRTCAIRPARATPSPAASWATWPTPAASIRPPSAPP